MNKTVVLTASIATLAVNVMANGIVTGPIEPGTTNPTVTGYNSIAGGQNTSVSGTSAIVLGRDNDVAGDDTTVIGSNNGTVHAGQSTIIGYNNQVDSNREQVIIGANSQTAGQGATVIGTHSQSTAWDAVTIGNNAISDKANSVAIGTNSVTDDAVGFGQMNINGKTYVFAGENPQSVVSFGAQGRPGASGVTYYNRQLQNVSAGRVTADSLDAVNGSQLFAVVDEVGTNGKNLAQLRKEHDQFRANARKIYAEQKEYNTYFYNTVKDHGSRIATNENDIKDIKSDVANHESRITTLENRTFNIGNEINNRITSTNQRLNKLGASSAALSGLHPLDFNRDDKVSYAVSYGHYRNANAVALGVFARPNERIMVGAGMTLGAEKQYTLNLAIKTGKGSDYLAEAKSDKGRITQLETLVAKLMAEVEELKGGK